MMDSYGSHTGGMVWRSCGWPSHRHPADWIPKFIWLMSLPFGHLSLERLVKGIDVVLIESLLMDPSLVLIQLFLVWNPLQRSEFSF